MPNLAGVLKDEIRRLARKEVRQELAATKKTVATQRKAIAELKRQLHAQTRVIQSLRKGTATRGAAAEANGAAEAPRFSPGWVAKHRHKLELSAADYGALIGVSALTVYNWEKGKTRPRAKQLEAWGAIRNLGKREAWDRLEQM